MERIDAIRVLILICFLFVSSSGSVFAFECPLLDKSHDGAMRKYAVKYAQSIEDSVKADIIEWSKKIYGRSVEFKLDYPSDKKCSAMARVENGVILVPPIFLELIALKAEDIEILGAMIFRYLPFVMTMKEKQAKDYMLCVLGLANYNHVFQNQSIKRICGTAFPLFLKAQNSLRQSKSSWKPVNETFYQTFYVALAHEYGHLLLDHDSENLRLEDEIAADEVAFEIYSEGKPDGGEVAFLKLFFATHAALVDSGSLARRLDLDVGDVDIGKVQPASKRYLSSECRAFEILKRKGLENMFEDEVRSLLPQIENLVPGLDIEKELSNLGIKAPSLLLNCG